MVVIDLVLALVLVSVPAGAVVVVDVSMIQPMIVVAMPVAKMVPVI